MNILDLGASPGSWSLYILRRLCKRCTLTSADLNALSRQYDGGLFDAENFCFIQGDILSTETRDILLARGPFSLVLSDAAPLTTGNRSVDTARSLLLVETVLSYVESSLVKGGNLAVKVFQGGDTVELLKQIRFLFASVKSFKPEACRSESFEAYFIGLGKK
jgi:23S rRNA (uridine2552-2'-O)-methyltransferase